MDAPVRIPVAVGIGAPTVDGVPLLDSENAQKYPACGVMNLFAGVLGKSLSAKQ